MFREYFKAAQDFLRSQGMNSVLRNAKTLSKAEIDMVDRRTDQRMPGELRRFYLEMGDAFQFIPDDVPDSQLSGWEPNWLSDYEVHNTGFWMAIEEEVAGELGKSHPRVDPQLLSEEGERRKKWIPFYGFVGGGDVLCLDSDGRVRSYEALSWRSCPDSWSFVLAYSFSDFVQKWSRYSFVCPWVEWTSFCRDRSGIFDWSPQHFDTRCLRAT